MANVQIAESSEVVFTINSCITGKVANFIMLAAYVLSRQWGENGQLSFLYILKKNSRAYDKEMKWRFCYHDIIIVRELIGSMRQLISSLVRFPE